MVCVYDISVFGVCDVFVGLAVLMGGRHNSTSMATLKMRLTDKADIDVDSTEVLFQSYERFKGLGPSDRLPICLEECVLGSSIISWLGGTIVFVLLDCLYL